MRPWDFRGPAARLHEALDMLLKTTESLRERWNDPAMEALQKNYFIPLAGKVQEAIEAVARLDSVFAEAAKECGESAHE